MKRLQFVAFLLVAAQATITTASGQAPTPPSTRLQFTTTSAEARSALQAAWEDGTNLFIARAVIQAQKAVTLDPSFGLARAFWAYNSSTALGMPPAQREQELNRAVADAARASTGELIIAMAMRAQGLGRLAESQALAVAAVTMMPDEPLAGSFRAVNAPVADRMSLTVEMTRKFPTYAAPFYRLAILQRTAGDTATALKTIQEYVRLAPNHPNAHDAYAQMLAQTGRPAEALPHYERAVELDKTFMQSYAGMAGSHVLLKKYPEAIADMQRAQAVDPTFAPAYQIIGVAHLAMGHPDQSRATFLAGAEKAPTPAAKVAPLTAGAVMHVSMGKPKLAIAELVTLATSFEQQDLRAQAAAARRNAALIEAAFGDRKAVAGHLAKAAELTPPPAPNAPPAAGAAAFRFAALAYALSGQLDLARASAAQFAQAVANGNAAQQSNNRELTAIIAVGDKNFDLAKAELAQAGPAATLGKALLAAALKTAGKKAEATALKTEILNGNPVPTVFDVIARAKVQKV